MSSRITHRANYKKKKKEKKAKKEEKKKGGKRQNASMRAERRRLRFENACTSNIPIRKGIRIFGNELCCASNKENSRGEQRERERDGERARETYIER